MKNELKRGLAVVALASAMAWVGCKVENGVQPVQAQSNPPSYTLHLGDEGDLAGGIHFYRFHDDRWATSYVCFEQVQANPSMSCVKQ